jgi:hypothetical protein
MAAVKISIQDGSDETVLTIPLFLFAAASKFLPETAQAAMLSRGMGVQGFIDAAEAGKFTGPVIEMFDPKTNDRVAISIE